MANYTLLEIFLFIMPFHSFPVWNILYVYLFVCAHSQQTPRPSGGFQFLCPWWKRGDDEAVINFWATHETMGFPIKIFLCRERAELRLFSSAELKIIYAYPLWVMCLWLCIFCAVSLHYANEADKIFKCSLSKTLHISFRFITQLISNELLRHSKAHLLKKWGTYWLRANHKWLP